MTALPLPSEVAQLMRTPSRLMTAERLAALQPSRVSASRALMSRAVKQRWVIKQTRFQIDKTGRGIACYRIDIGGWRFSFPVFSFQPSATGRTGRIIGRAWDMMGALVEGDMTAADFDTTGVELPKLYEGRATPGTLIWCRSNRSGRFFNAARDALVAGTQPDIAMLAASCYLMRNTGLDGNGTFGTKTFLTYEPNHPLRWSLAAQMLSAYMMRVFAQDLVHHLARLENPSASELDPALRRFLGLGNGSALGLMLFVNNHPRLIDQWISIREAAIAQAKATVRSADAVRQLIALLQKAIVFRRQDRAEYEALISSAAVAADLQLVQSELSDLLARIEAGHATPALPLAVLCESLDGRIAPEALETLHSLMIELVPDTADRLVDTLALDEELVGRPEMPLRRLREIIRDEYAWAFNLDLTSEASQRYVWYKSVTAEEPRRGPRSEANDAINLGLDLARLVVRLEGDLARQDPALSVARFLAVHPQHRAIVTRVQALAGSRYHSPHADIMSEAFVPAHITRLLNVGLHGIEKTRDFLNRNLRGVLFHGAPLPEDLATGTADDHWFYPAEPVVRTAA
jgi:hypothetical protein